MAGPTRVLYVDDDLALVRLVQRALGRRGYEVEHAASAEAALTRLQQGAVDVIALDHYLPTGTGLDLLQELRNLSPAPAAVYVTGASDTSIAVSALKSGATDYVPKTVTDDFIELLATAIDQAYEKRRLEEAKEQSDREMRVARERAELLLREVNHRVANSLALVSSLVRLQAGAVADQAARDALEETQARIFAISGIHKRLYTATDIRFVEIDEYLGSIAEHLDTTMKASGHEVRIKVDAEPLKVPTDAAVSIGVVVTELVTNAFKYAYPAGESGEVRVGLKRVDPETAALFVADDGIGWSGAGPVKGTGLGTRIVQAMATTLESRVEYELTSPGTRVTLRFGLGA